jgi:hypothetical protein
MFGLLISESLLMLRAEGSEQAINDLHIDFRAIEDVSPQYTKLIPVWPIRPVVMYKRESTRMGWTTLSRLD